MHTHIHRVHNLLQAISGSEYAVITLIPKPRECRNVLGACRAAHGPATGHHWLGPDDKGERTLLYEFGVSGFDVFVSVHVPPSSPVYVEPPDESTDPVAGDTQGAA